jgi:hypothetical protein
MGLSDKAMLVKLSISQWTARKFDRKVTEKVEEEYNTKEVGRFNKLLIAQEPVKAVSQIASRARQFHYENTLPWGDDQSRLLPVKNFDEYSAKMREYRREFEEAVDKFVEGYPQFMEEAKVKLNGMFNEADYPSKYDIHRKYSIAVSINPLPEADDVRIKLRDDEVERIKQDIEQRAKTAQGEAMKDLWVRLYDAVKHMASKLSDKDAKFKNTLVGNLVELCQLLPRLNVLNDPNLEQMRDEIEGKLCQFTPDALRKNKGDREFAAKEASNILTKMHGYMGAEKKETTTV